MNPASNEGATKKWNLSPWGADASCLMRQRIALLCLVLLSCLFPMRATADDGLAALAESKRGAALNLGVVIGGRQMNGLGAFISADGLALVDLSSIATAERPTVATADGTKLPLGTILGIFADHELALVKFDHRPKVWLPLAKKEPEMGETLALVALSQPDLRSIMVPPVVGPVVAKRSGVASNIRVRHYLRILSLGSVLTREQQPWIGPGSFAVNQQGQLAAIKNGIQMEGNQALILLAPVSALAEQIDKMVKAGNVIPFPLPAASNPIDLALLSEDFDRMSMALQQGDRATARNLFGKLLARYPASPRLKGLTGNSMLRGAGAAPVDPDFLQPIDPKDPTAEQVEQLLGRAIFLVDSKKDYDGAIGELKAALALCPEDYPQVPRMLSVIYLQLKQLEEAERFLRAALASEPEAISLVQAMETVLTRRGKLDEADKMTERYYELGRIYRRR